MSIDISLQIATTAAALPTEATLQQWVETVLTGRRQTAEVNLRLVDRPEIQHLNRQYRGQDKPTNVLSFPADFPEGVDIPFLGDIVICAGVIEQEASDQDKTPEAHWAHMVIHGCLHLLGYDHIEDTEAETMEALETQLLSQLGYPCPYH